ncbi:MAG: ATP-binding cassette domain-containing protein [Symploca sp. SIO1B1]|nr:ATP-binding cassette domain-containing protein [Symploca sp. SIO1C2]NER93816.1 ATP-binding cassette domain-containing protein [Symploca sp. SIO1B1]
MLLEVVDLNFTHVGQKQPTIQNINLTLQAGELVVLAGATGSGKSTLLNCITGIAPEYTGGKLSGQVLYRGSEITHNSIRQRSQFMGIMLQNVETQLFTDQVWNEVVFGLENWNLPPEQIKSLASATLMEFDLVSQKAWAIRQLSAGQKQRLLLACLLTQHQDILLLDEPFAFLDTAGVKLLLELLQQRVTQGQAVLLIEHRLELLQHLCDRAYFINNGCIKPGELSTPTAEDSASPVPANYSPPGSQYEVVLQTQNLSWGGYPAFPDLQVAAGEVVLLKGDNGCGKTTLLKLLSGLLKPSTGRLEILGRDLTRSTVVKIARFVGFVLQNPNHQLFAESVQAEVTQSGVSPKKAEALLEQLNLNHCLEQHPHALSQGQKRRLALGAVLVRQPRICLLDEIMVGQDPTSLTLMLQTLKTFTEQGGVLIFTSHDPGVAKILNPRVVQLTK